MKLLKKLKTKSGLIALALLIAAGTAVYFIFFYQTTMGFGQEQLDIMNTAKAEYEQKKETTAADDAIQNIYQALKEVRDKYAEIEDPETGKEFKDLVYPTYQELRQLVSDYLEEEVEDLAK
ncbi:MAG: hypothetical protein KBT12_02495 [Bacteroidales bacterium]|nr:hypothetical protein [Candidatus Physcousia equi]